MLFYLVNSIKYNLTHPSYFLAHFTQIEDIDSTLIKHIHTAYIFLQTFSSLRIRKHGQNRGQCEQKRFHSTHFFFFWSCSHFPPQILSSTQTNINACILFKTLFIPSVTLLHIFLAFVSVTCKDIVVLNN